MTKNQYFRFFHKGSEGKLEQGVEWHPAGINGSDSRWCCNYGFFVCLVKNSTQEGGFSPTGLLRRGAGSSGSGTVVLLSPEPG